MNRMFNNCKWIRVIVLSLSLFMLTGCKSHPVENRNSSLEDSETSRKSEQTETTTTTTDVLDGPEKVEYLITANKEAMLSVPCGENGRIDISFPAGAMKDDTTLELTLLETRLNEEWIEAGFHLNEVGKDGVVLQVPAIISYLTSNDLPNNAFIVKYNEDGTGYKPVLSQWYSTPEGYGLFAYVDSFSAYGVKIISETELEQMADEVQEKGFNWSLEVNDRASVTEGYSGEISGSTTYEVYLDMVLINSQASSPTVMNGPYQGFATMQSKAAVTMEGIPFGFSLVEAKDSSASFTLQPIFKQYLPEPSSGLAPLSGLVPVGYEGKGVLHMRNPIDIGGVGGEDGINMMEVARQMEGEWGMDLPGLQDEDVPFTVITDGPIAYVTLHLEGRQSLTLVGSIVGYSKDQKPKIVPLNTEEQRNKKPESNTKTTQYQDENGTIHYDIDGDGQTDFTLYPLDLNND